MSRLRVGDGMCDARHAPAAVSNMWRTSPKVRTSESLLSNLAQVERLQRKFTTIHSTLAQQTSGTPKVDSEPSLRASQAADHEPPAKVNWGLALALCDTRRQTSILQHCSTFSQHKHALHGHRAGQA